MALVNSSVFVTMCSVTLRLLSLHLPCSNTHRFCFCTVLTHSAATIPVDLSALLCALVVYTLQAESQITPAHIPSLWTAVTTSGSQAIPSAHRRNSSSSSHRRHRRHHLRNSNSVSSASAARSSSNLSCVLSQCCSLLMACNCQKGCRPSAWAAITSVC